MGITLSVEQEYILLLLRKSFDASIQLGDTPNNTSILMDYILKSGILLTVYRVLPSELQSLLKERYYAIVLQTIQQEHEGEQVLEEISKAGLQCIALKGWEMKDLYPQKAMRQMADLDILVKPYKYSQIKEIMRKLNYAIGKETSWKHDNFIKDRVHIEMHKRLTDDSSEIQKWEKEIWTRAKAVRENIYKMSTEDYYIFHFIHLYKDVLNGAIGLRRIVDTWLLQNQRQDMDTIKVMLQRFGLWTFHERIVRLSYAVMEGMLMDENSEVLLSHAFKHGIYGSDESYKAGRIASMGRDIKNGKLNSVVAAIFLPLYRMKAQFPLLERWPILLPWYWVKRIGLFLRGNIKTAWTRLNYTSIGDVEYQETKQVFTAAGISTTRIK